MTSLRVLALVAVTGLAAAPSASARALARLDGPPPLRPFAGPLHDRVLGAAGEKRAASAPGADASAARTYRLTDGSQLRVAVSPSYGDATPTDVQALVRRLFSGLMHGPEMNRLTVLIDTPQEVSSACGSGEALACYDPRAERMYVPGQQTPEGQPPLQFVVAHEYGHHIAANRSNWPWAADEWGPKHWATAEHVCQLVSRHKLFPGAEDTDYRYRRNPGEAWAESYAMRQYPQFLSYWAFTSYLKPDSGGVAFGAIRHDIQAPWRGPVRSRRSGWLSSRRRSLSVRVPTRLDGVVQAQLAPARGLRVALRAYDHRGRFLGQTTRRAASLLVCGEPSLRLAVVRTGGTGRVRMTLARP